MIEKIDPSTLGLANKGIEDIFFTEAYDIFLEYLNEQSITCFNYLDDNNTDPKKANITEVPIKEYSFHYIYAELYKQKEKDIINLFSRMIKMNCQELNCLRSAHHFLNDLYEDKLTLGKLKRYNFSIIFELDYIKISCEDSIFKLSVKDNKIIFHLNNHTVTIDRNSFDISEQFKEYVLYSMAKTRKDISRLFEGKDVDAVYICDRMNKSLIDIYMEQQFKGFTIKCPYKLAKDNGFKNNVHKGKYGSIYYKTSIYNEAVILVNNYLEKNYAGKCTQLINLIYFMNSIEKTKWSLRLKIHNDSKYKIKYEEVLEISLIYGNSKIIIDVGKKDYFFTSFYDIKNTLFKEDNDLNTTYTYVLNKFHERILKTCEIDSNMILKEHLDIYRMHLI